MSIAQLTDAKLQLDRLCKKLAEPVVGDDGETVPGQRQEHRDATILDSLPGVGRTVLATMLAESQDALQRRDYHALPKERERSIPLTAEMGRKLEEWAEWARWGAQVPPPFGSQRAQKKSRRTL